MNVSGQVDNDNDNDDDDDDNDPVLKSKKNWTQAVLDGTRKKKSGGFQSMGNGHNSLL